MEDWVLVDTCIWASFFGKPSSPEKAAVDALLDADRIAIVGPILGEVLLGFRRKDQADWVASRLRLAHELEITWAERKGSGGSAVAVLEAVGSSPADQNVTILEWRVTNGALVQAGDLLALCEADKATFELRAPESGQISELLPLHVTVNVGGIL